MIAPPAPGDAIRKRWPWVNHLFADGAYDRTQLMDKAALPDFVIVVLPRRCVVERTFSWMNLMTPPGA